MEQENQEFPGRYWEPWNGVYTLASTFNHFVFWLLKCFGAEIIINCFSVVYQCVDIYFGTGFWEIYYCLLLFRSWTENFIKAPRHLARIIALGSRPIKISRISVFILGANDLVLRCSTFRCQVSYFQEHSKRFPFQRNDELIDPHEKWFAAADIELSTLAAWGPISAPTPPHAAFNV